jgi:hypothetical protein
MESLIASGRFTNKEVKEINYCCIYLQAFYISDIMNKKGNKIEAVAGRGQKQSGRKSTWEWPIQQRPTAWKAWKYALEYLASDGDIGDLLREWKSDFLTMAHVNLLLASSSPPTAHVAFVPRLTHPPPPFRQQK